MAIAYVQALLSGQSKTAGTSLSLNTGTPTVTAGNDIFVAFASDDVGSSYSVSDNLSNTYALVKEEINTGNVKTQLWRASNIAGGTLNDITISWTTNATAKAGVSGEFSGVGAEVITDSESVGSTQLCRAVVDDGTVGWVSGDLVIGACGFERPNGDSITASGADAPFSPRAQVAKIGTTGGSAASNITVTLEYGIGSGTSNSADRLSAIDNTASGDVAGAGAVYSPAVAAASLLLRNRNQAVFLRR